MTLEELNQKEEILHKKYNFNLSSSGKITYEKKSNNEDKFKNISVTPISKEYVNIPAYIDSSEGESLVINELRNSNVLKNGTSITVLRILAESCLIKYDLHGKIHRAYIPRNEIKIIE